MALRELAEDKIKELTSREARKGGHEESGSGPVGILGAARFAISVSALMIALTEMEPTVSG